MIYSILIACAVPLLFLYLVKWLDFFETQRPRLIFVALAWGAIACALSYLVDHPLVPLVGRPMVAIRIGPAVEEIFKSLILVYLVRRADYTYFVDGAIYGFAVGVGFAVAENMLYLSRVDVDTGLIVAITRAFSSSVMHGSSTALVGIAIGGFPLARVVHPLVALVIGWAAAIAYHMTYNHIAFQNYGRNGLWILCGLAFAGLVLVALTIVWGLRRERRRLRHSIGLKTGVSRGEASLIRHMDDLGVLLDPVERRFGSAKRDEVAAVLLLAAHLSMKQAQIRATRDAELQAELAAEITAAKRALRQQRGEVGMYVMSYVRSIVPRTAWSLWARLGQRLAADRAGGARAAAPVTAQAGRVALSAAPEHAAQAGMWSRLQARPVPSRIDGLGLYERLEHALAAREAPMEQNPMYERIGR